MPKLAIAPQPRSNRCVSCSLVCEEIGQLCDGCNRYECVECYHPGRDGECWGCAERNYMILVETNPEPEGGRE